MMVLAIVFAAWFANGIDKPSSRVRHYECYSGGVLVVDQEYRLSKSGALLDESNNKVILDNLECVVTR